MSLTTPLIECNNCCNSFERKEIVTNHVSHPNWAICKKCMDLWLEKHNSCPFCNAVIKESKDEAAKKCFDKLFIIVGPLASAPLFYLAAATSSALAQTLCGGIGGFFMAYSIYSCVNLCRAPRYQY